MSRIAAALFAMTIFSAPLIASAADAPAKTDAKTSPKSTKKSSSKKSSTKKAAAPKTDTKAAK